MIDNYMMKQICKKCHKQDRVVWEETVPSYATNRESDEELWKRGFKRCWRAMPEHDTTIVKVEEQVEGCPFALEYVMYNAD